MWLRTTLKGVLGSVLALALTACGLADAHARPSQSALALTHAVRNYFAIAAQHQDYQVSAPELYRWIYQDHRAVQIIDVRQPLGPFNFFDGHIPGAMDIPVQLFWMEIGLRTPETFRVGLPDPSGVVHEFTLRLVPLAHHEPIVVMCYDGNGGEMIPAVLRLLGYDAYSLQYGISSWNKTLNVWPTPGSLTNLPVVAGPSHFHGPSVAPTGIDIAGSRYTARIAALLKSMSQNYPPGYSRPWTIAPAMLYQALTSVAPPFVLDLRTPREFAAAHIPGSVNIPFADLGQALGQLPRDREIVVVSAHLQRAAQTCVLLRLLGYHAYALKMGLAAWNSHVASVVPTATYPLTTGTNS
jgi:rhodanese-related sulfurtransferase